MQDVVAGVDIGGTFTKFGLVTSSGELLIKDSIQTDSESTYELFFKKLYLEIKRLAENVDRPLKIIGIGVGAPTGNYLTGVIDDASNLFWQGKVPVIDVLETVSGLPVSLANDANAAAIGEHQFGAARELKHFVVITIGTGLGSGIVMNGKLLLGKNGHAGELGHITVYYDGRLCSCGKRGCLETYVSGAGMVATLKEIVKSGHQHLQTTDIDKNFTDARSITEAAREGDPAAIETFEETGKILGMKLADTAAHLNPEAIFLTGGVARAGELLFNPVKKYMEQHLLGMYKNTIELQPSGLAPEHSAILGSAALMYDKIRGKMEKGLEQ